MLAMGHVGREGRHDLGMDAYGVIPARALVSMALDRQKPGIMGAIKGAVREEKDRTRTFLADPDLYLRPPAIDKSARPPPSRMKAGVIMGSGSDSRVMREAARVLDDLEIGHEDMVVSAHRTPERLQEYARHAEESGIGVIIAGAGGAAHLPGMIASFTTIPVVGVPIMAYADKGGPGGGASAFGGLDALLSMSEMPTGTPVGTVGVNKAANAALYAARILACGSEQLRARLLDYKEGRRRQVASESERMRESGLAGFEP